jgi:hypothetical protein
VRGGAALPLAVQVSHQLARASSTRPSAVPSLLQQHTACGGLLQGETDNSPSAPVWLTD